MIRERRRVPRDYGAYISADGVTVVGYRRAGEGVEVLRHERAAVTIRSADEAGDALASALSSFAPSGSTVVVVLRGLGTVTELLALPPADTSVLRPVVEREMARLHPDLPNSSVDFTLTGTLERRQSPRTDPGKPQRQILAAAAPRELIDALTAGAASAGAKLQHVTVLARALDRVAAELDGDAESTAVILDLAHCPLLGFFHDGSLRYLSEPPSSYGEMTDGGSEWVLVDQLGRGGMFLRQQFRGAALERVLVATDPQRYERIVGAVRTELPVDVHPLGRGLGPPEVVAALGGILDAESDDGINLYPLVQERAQRSARSRRRTMTATAAAALVALGAWTVIGLADAMRTTSQLDEERARATTALASAETPLRIAQARRQNTDVVRAVRSLRSERTLSATILRALYGFASDRVEIASISMSRADDAWNISLQATANAFSSADALSRSTALYNDIAAGLSPRSIQLDSLAYGNADEGVSTKFSISLVMPASGDAPVVLPRGAQ